jgi:hypothetical protein
MLSDLPLTTIDAAHLQQLVDNATRENRRLDFKLTLDLATREERVEFLRDVIAMANADGGTIVYGVGEGEGDDAGVAIALPGLEMSVDATSNLIDSLTRDNIDERLSVLQHDVKLPSGRRAYLVRIPASPLAPHMIANLRTAPARFYVRANTSNEPMTARQIKEAALRHGAAIDRAATRIGERIVALRKSGSRRVVDASGSTLRQDQVVLHMVPLFPAEGGWNYSDPSVITRLLQVPTFGNWGSANPNLVFTQYGAFKEYSQRAHTGFLRDGTLEGQEYEVLSDSPDGRELYCVGSDLAESVDRALIVAAGLSRDGLLPLPLLVQLHLLTVEGSWLQATRQRRMVSPRKISEADVTTESFVLTEWGEKDRILKQLLDHVWQAWGSAACNLFEADGRRMQIDREGRRISPADIT